ncbi:MAG: hypothetical protein GX558_12270 [Clostridiales bacterium]|nr:hypothetical protein [Clostridiales bacterium]
MTESIDRMIAELAAHADRYERAARSQEAAFLGRSGPPPLLLHGGLTDAQQAYGAYDYKEIHFDPDKMLANELRSALAAMNGGRQAAPSVRANMGCGIVPALMGITPLLFKDKMPWVKQRLPKEALREMRPSDLRILPEFRQALDHMVYMAKALRGSGVRVYPVDIQGALDTAHIALGDDIFYQMYDDPEFVHHLLSLSCAAAEMAFAECLKVMPGSGEFVPHYNALAMPRGLGGIKLSEDTSTLLNAGQIEEFVVPYMNRLLSFAGGGYVHYCGANPHLYRAVMNQPLAHAINFGNPEKHDMPAVLRDCAERGKLYYGSLPRAADTALIDHFSALLCAAQRNDRNHLLLQMSCESHELDQVRSAWDQACEAIEVNP